MVMIHQDPELEKLFGEIIAATTEKLIVGSDTSEDSSEELTSGENTKSNTSLASNSGDIGRKGKPARRIQQGKRGKSSNEDHQQQ